MPYDCPMMVKRITIAVLNYQDSLQSAVHGLSEVFSLGNKVVREQELACQFHLAHISESNLTQPLPKQANLDNYQVVIIPPSLASQYYLAPSQTTLDWLQRQYRQGAIMASACAGAFILASAGICDQRPITTHWNLAGLFSQQHPQVPLQVEKIIINHGDIICAGGMMAWLDLAFEIIAHFTQLSVVRQLGKILVVDTGAREQRFYAQFKARFDHGDQAMIPIQHYIQKHSQQPVNLATLANICAMSERNLIRRFSKATGLTPTQYIQQIRIQQACNWLETSTHSFEWIAQTIGYEDVNACRIVFTRIMGLSPKAFRQRFKK